ncbi:MAG TPA: DUF996 domain-containing protein [Nitrososphaerales archaeon]|nr:DUF996 domain-containing protein [Nitrososphaerales archaeon]
MGKLESAKIFGGIGSLLQLVPGVAIIGYILTLIAVKYISDEVKDGTIFTDMIYAVITGIIGIAFGATLFFLGVATSVITLGIGALFGLVSFLFIAWIALIISSIFIRRAFGKMATQLNVGTFRTAGTLYFVGALLTIILVGFVLLFVAFILQIIAFFSINEARPMAPGPMAAPLTPAPAATAAPTSPAPQSTTKYCANCGTQMASFAMYCPKCGARQA